jgi:hypothetical protein
MIVLNNVFNTTTPIEISTSITVGKIDLHMTTC